MNAPNSKHTPGPWVTEETDGGMFGVMDERGYAIADMAVTYSSIDDDEHEANARLIAAAPDQHDALCSAPVLSKYHTATGFDLEGFVRDYENWSKKKRAAIAKATGPQE